MNLSLKFSAAACAVALLLAANPVHAQVTPYTDSSLFAAAAAGPVVTEDFSSGYEGQAIASSGVFNGITYTFNAGSSATLQGGLITSQFGGFNGFLLGANQGNSLPEVDPFYTNDSITLTFPYTVVAVGVFIDANPYTGVYTLAQGSNLFTLDSSVVSPDAPTGGNYFFLGIVSTTPFSTITVGGQDTNSGPFFIAGVQSVPEPATMTLLASGVLGLGAITRRRRSRR